MILIDDKLLDNLGLANFSDYREVMGDQLIELLNLRVGNKLTELLTDEQLEEFDATAESAKFSWLDRHVGSVEDLIKKELADTVAEIKRLTPTV